MNKVFTEIFSVLSLKYGHLSTSRSKKPLIINDCAMHVQWCNVPDFTT